MLTSRFKEAPMLPDLVGSQGVEKKEILVNVKELSGTSQMIRNI
jgi:hypothetical protein